MEEEDDMHICLVCQRTIAGLMNYVNHKKTECTGRKVAKEETDLPSVNSGMRSQAYGLGTSVSYMSPSYVTTGQPVFSSGDGYQSQDAVNLLTSQTNITGSLDVFDTTQFQTNTTDTSLQDICLKTYSPPTTQNASSSHSLYDSQASISHQQTSCDLAGFGLSPSIFTHSNLNKHRDTTSVHENHGLLNACISNGVEADFGNAVNIHIPSTFPILSSEKSPNPNSDAININEIISDSHGKSQTNNKNATEKVEDFFQSLELMSKTNPKTEKGSNFNQPLLPISNILNNLTFSSDEEDLGFSFADDVSLDSMSENSDDNTAPPSNYTGAKWKPGEKPNTSRVISNRNKPVFRGKWPPGQVPEQTSAKYYGGRPKGGKNISSLLSSKTKKTKSQKQTKSSSSKIFHCNFCDVTFECRFKYSNHCGSATHKERVFGKREDFQRSFGKGQGKSAAVEMKIDPDRTDKIQEVTNEESNELNNHVSEIADEQLNEKAPEEADLEGSKANYEEECTTATNQDKITEETTDDIPFCSAVPLQLHICTVCDKKFPNKYFISSHMLTKYHRNRAYANKESAFGLLERYHKYIVRLSPYQCGICRFYFNSAKYFNIHMQSDDHLLNCEDLIGEMMCSLCKFKTHNHEELLGHIASPDHTHNISKRNRLCIIKERHIECQCKYCGVVMRSFSKLKYHVQHKHSDRQVVQGVKKRQVGVHNRPSCTECNKQFQCVSALQLHVRRKHTGEKPHRCEVCDVSFAGKHALTQHTKTSKHMQRLFAVENVKIKVLPEKNIKESTMVKENINVSNNAVTGASIVNLETDNKDEDGIRQSEYDNEIIVKQEYKVEVLPDSTEDKKFLVEMELDDPMEDDYDSGQSVNAVEDRWTPGRKKIKNSKRTKRKEEKIKKDVIKKRKRRKKREVPVKIHKCDHCSFTANSYNDLRPHYLKEHSAQIKTCELCDQVFLTEKAYKLHTLSREHQRNINRPGGSVTEEYYTCHVCKKKFTDEKYCKFHTAYQHFHLISEEAVLNEYEGKDVTRIKYEKVLDEIKDLELSASVQCPDCNKTLKKSNFLEHLRIHSGDKPFKCKMCPKEFISTITLRRHLLGHFGCQERTCEVCGKHYKKIPSFESHMKLHLAQSGDAGKVHTCEVCGQAFYFERQLQFHLRRHRKREFVCTYPGCHWKFVFATELNYHMKSHTQQKPFLCDKCGYATVSKYRLQRHHRTHTGERNYHCEYCTYKAGNSTHLHRHMRIHIGSKPFKCPYCEYSCNTHENMRKHIAHTKKHEGLNIYPCKFCKYGTNSCNEFRNHLHETHESEIGPNFHVAALSTFTGLYDKSLDPKEPEEGNKIFQVRERVQKDQKPRKPRKRKILIPVEMQEIPVEQKSPKSLDNENTVEMKDKNFADTGYNKKKQESKTLNSDINKMMNSVTSVEDDMVAKSQGPGMSSSYYSQPMNHIRLQNQVGQIQSSIGVPQYIFVPDHQFKPTAERIHSKSELQFSYTTDTGQNLSHLQYNQTATHSSKNSDPHAQPTARLETDDQKPAIMMYHDYCTKYGTNGETEGPGNLIIDMNFNPGQ